MKYAWLVELTMIAAGFMPQVEFYRVIDHRPEYSGMGVRVIGNDWDATAYVDANGDFVTLCRGGGEVWYRLWTR